MGYETQWDGEVELSGSEEDIKSAMNAIQCLLDDDDNQWIITWIETSEKKKKYFLSHTYETYNYDIILETKWLSLIIKQIFQCQNIKISDGKFDWRGEERNDLGIIEIKNDKVILKYAKITYVSPTKHKRRRRFFY